MKVDLPVLQTKLQKIYKIGGLATLASFPLVFVGLLWLTCLLFIATFVAFMVWLYLHVTTEPMPSFGKHPVQTSTTPVPPSANPNPATGAPQPGDTAPAATTVPATTDMAGTEEAAGTAPGATSATLKPLTRRLRLSGPPSTTKTSYEGV